MEAGLVALVTHRPHGATLRPRPRLQLSGRLPSAPSQRNTGIMSYPPSAGMVGGDASLAFPQADLPPYTNEDAAALFHPGAAPVTPPQVPALRAPVCVPQQVAGWDSPIARVYSPELAAAGVDVKDWMEFVDAINIALIASPPLRVVDTAGLIIGFVPAPWALIAGPIMQTVAQTAAHVISKTLSDRLIRKANTDFFNPRGLVVRLCTNRAMRQLVKIDGPEKKPPNQALMVAKALGRGAQNFALRLPIPFMGRIVETFGNQPRVDASEPDVVKRHLSHIEGYVAPVSFDNIPPLKTPESLMDKTSELAVKIRTWTAARTEGKDSAKRRLLAIQEGKMAPLPADGRKGRLAARRARRGRKPRRKTRLRVAKIDRIEKNNSIGLMWLVVMNFDQDAQITNRELADNNDDQDVIRNEEFEHEAPIPIDSSDEDSEEDEEHA
ncbi:uncharacterized protein EV422DRAFT_542494 [Fimicolochytrium jonesii]|uniref:uncharacterized protein n=1 Tax=Fimicolochytrium jonesii TaxID=1396493 RepID=UPI0022FDD052|nr:uncharacterized protein EV422DRAFT_542494 [Fimicolochytrium jonesii]KAI8817121.1 hypothetical protein EV422DRAFT_542494 [Fimicolochytrium jonesii]